MASPIEETQIPNKGNAASGKGSGESTARRVTPKDRTNLGKVEGKLNELAATIAMGQQGIGIAANDERMFMSGHVTAEMMPAVIHAWIELGRENKNVERALIRMAEGGAWGGVLITTTGLVFSQAQVWGAIPREVGNPFMDLPTPPSEEVKTQAAENDTPAWAAHTSEDANPGVDQSNNPAVAAAERQRKRAEEQRKRDAEAVKGDD